MNKKQDYKRFLRAVLWNPEAFLLLVLGAGAIIWAANKYWTQGRTSWGETKATLTDIQLNERQRNQEKEVFLKLTFDYSVDNVKYQAFSEEILLNEFQAQAKTKELKEAKKSVTVYYQHNSPADATFDLEETQADDNLLYVLIPCMFMIAGLGYWGLKIGYEHYFKRES